MWGILLVLAASVIYGIEPSLRALVLEAGLTPAETMCVTSFILFLISAFNCRRNKQTIAIEKKGAAWLLAVGAVGLGATSLLLTMAYRFIPVGCATVIHFMYPSLVCISLVFFFGSPLTWKKVLAMALSVAGVVCISGDGFYGSLTGILLALCSSLTYAFYTLMIDRKGTIQHSMETRMFYITLGCFLFSFAVKLVSEGSGCWSLGSGGILVVCGLLSSGAAFCYAAGVKLTGASRAAFFSLFEPITSMVFSTMVYGYSFSGITVFGCVLSMVAILVVCMEEGRGKAKAA